MAIRALATCCRCLRHVKSISTLSPTACITRSSILQRSKRQITNIWLTKAISHPSTRSFHFATSEYAFSFLDLPRPDTQAIRSSALTYLKSFEPDLWHTDPMVSLVGGKKLAGSVEIQTVGALGDVNGRQLLASSEQVAILKDHIQSFQSSQTDLRTSIRQVEHLLFTKHVGYLVGNQCIDFQKQDGVTEIEEAITTNAVERRLNDILLEEERVGRIHIDRRPIFVASVSSSSNFLDLSRNVLRSLELGIPVVVQGRQHTSQHSYRWTQLLVDLCADAGIDAGMITFLSCSPDDVKDIMVSCQEATGNLYITGTRSLAAEIKTTYLNTIASTGGPNTMVCTDWNEDALALKNAIANSAAVESAGQCTALRHCVVPSSVTDEACRSIFDCLQSLESAEVALRDGRFVGVAKNAATMKTPLESSNSNGYVQHNSINAFFNVRDESLPESDIPEFWRQVVVDFTKLDLLTSSATGKRQINEARLGKLTSWLNGNQPISLAVNGPRSEAIEIGLKLWERTSLVVNTIGSTDFDDMPPAMTSQARPQDGEIFGGFPPRNEMTRYTTYPVLIPSSNPSYGASYNTVYLQSKGSALSDYIIKSTKRLLAAIKDDVARGYCVVLIEYLQNVARLNPKQGFGDSCTVLWGIQRPPLGQKTVIRCDGQVCKWDHIAPIYVLFHATTARDQVVLSVDPSNSALIEFCRDHKLPHVVEAKDVAMQCASRDDVFHLVCVSDQSIRDWPMAGNFVSLYLPMGHLKSTKYRDEEFELHAQLSPKWLNTLF